MQFLSTGCIWRPCSGPKSEVICPVWHAWTFDCWSKICGKKCQRRNTHKGSKDGNNRVWGLGVSLKRSGGTIFKMSSSKFLPLFHMLLLLQGLGSTQQRMWTTVCGSAGTGSKNNVGVGSCCCPANLALSCLKNHLQTGESLRVPSGRY